MCCVDVPLGDAERAKRPGGRGVNSQGDPLYRDKATDLGTRLLQAFESPSGVPYHKLNLMTGVGVYKRISIGASQSVSG